MSSRYHRLLICDVKKKTTKIDSVGPFNVSHMETKSYITGVSIIIYNK